MINHQGFYITELRSLGDTKKPAIIKLKKGLNVLAGSSDTGKSYVLECFDYLFGGGRPPRKIKQSTGYKEIRMEIKTWFDDRVFTLSRKFGKNKVEVGECKIEEFESSSKKILPAKHLLGSESISSFLLGLCDLKDQKLKFNQRNVKKELSFRNLSKMCLIDEELIISKISPVHTQILTQRTLEKSLFRLILSGKDDEQLEEISDPKIIKNQIKGKIEYIQFELENKKKDLFASSEIVKELDLNQINLKVDEITGIMNISKKEVIEGEKERETYWKEIENLTSRKNHNNELKKRFLLLNKHYSSDLERLNFINEGSQYLSQIKEVNCPLCEGEIIDATDIISNEQYLKSLKEEYLIIKRKQVELQDMLIKLDQEEKLYLENISKLKQKFNEINIYIMNKLKPVLEFKQKELEDYLNLRDEKLKIDFINKEIKNLENEGDRLKIELDKKGEVGEIINLEENIYKKLSDEIKTILSNWGLNLKDIKLNKDTDDLELDGFPRNSHGKGYRAIFTSAFMLGLLKYCLENSGKHVFILILDSPLTTYREGDTTEEGDIKSEDIQERFFRDVKQIGENHKVQIFIIDNKEPPEDMKESINYEHFSKNPSSGRYGFYPIN